MHRATADPSLKGDRKKKIRSGIFFLQEFLLNRNPAKRDAAASANDL
jgi:hypothetical protein